MPEELKLVNGEETIALTQRGIGTACLSLPAPKQSVETEEDFIERLGKK